VNAVEQVRDLVENVRDKAEVGFATSLTSSPSRPAFRLRSRACCLVEAHAIHRLHRRGGILMSLGGEIKRIREFMAVPASPSANRTLRKNAS